MQSERDPREPLMNHIGEFLLRLKRALIFFMVAFGVGYWFAEDALRLIMIPIKQFLPPGVKLVYTQPFEQVIEFMKMSLILGVILGVPIIFAELFFFFKRGLTPKESRRVWSTCAGAWFLGLAGVVWSYYYLLPAILGIVLGYQTLDVSPMISLTYYLNASEGLLLIGALFFEIPYFMILTSMWGWIDPSVWSKQRKYAIVINSIVSAILSPPDVASMIVMMVPVQVLYEVGYWGAKLFAAKRFKEKQGKVACEKMV